jgi:MFS transporter, DHA2 family, methylenomycin A resistance protein
VAFAAFILTAGALGDRLGAKKVFMAGFGIFHCGVAGLRFGARAGHWRRDPCPDSLVLLNHAYPSDKERGRAVEFWPAGASLALTAGTSVGVARLALCNRYNAHATLSSTSRGKGRQSAGGVLAGMIIEGGRVGRADPWVVAAFGGFVALAVLFLLQERRAPQPMVPLSLFRNRTVVMASLVGLLVNSGLLWFDLRLQPVLPASQRMVVRCEGMRRLRAFG